MGHNCFLKPHTDLDTQQADTLVPHAHSHGQQIPEEVARGALLLLFLGTQPLCPPRQRLPQGPERFLGREHGVTAFRAIAPQAPSDHVAAGGGWGRSGGRQESGNCAQPLEHSDRLTASLGLTEVVRGGRLKVGGQAGLA